MTTRVFILGQAGRPSFYGGLLKKAGFLTYQPTTWGIAPTDHRAWVWHYSTEMGQELQAWQPHIILCDLTRGGFDSSQRQDLLAFLKVVRPSIPTRPKMVWILSVGAKETISEEERYEVERILVAPVGSELGSLLAEPTEEIEGNEVSHIQAHLAHAPQDGLGWSVLGDLHWGLGRLQAAKQAYTTALSCPPETLAKCPQHPLLTRGLLHQAMGQYGLALGDFLQVDKLLKYSWNFQRSLAELFKTLGFFRQAEQTYQRIDNFTIKKKSLVDLLRQSSESLFGGRVTVRIELEWDTTVIARTASRHGREISNGSP